MTPQAVIAELCTLGVEIDPANATLVKPEGFTRHADLAALVPVVGLHRAAILAEVVEPWRCGGCEKVFYVPAVDVRAFIGAVQCPEAECPHKGEA